MKTSLIIAVVSALPLLAQEPAPRQEAPAAPQGGQPQAQGMHRGHGRHMQGPRGPHMNQEMRKQMLEKFDADKDGKLSDEERKAAREDFMKNRPQRPQMPGQPGAQGPQGPRGPHMNQEMRKQMLEKFDADKDGKLSDEERKAAREDFMKNHPNMRGPRGGHGHGGWHHGQQGAPEQAPAPEQPAPQA